MKAPPTAESPHAKKSSTPVALAYIGQGIEALGLPLSQPQAICPPSGLGTSSFGSPSVRKTARDAAFKRYQAGESWESIQRDLAPPEPVEAGSTEEQP